MMSRQLFMQDLVSLREETAERSYMRLLNGNMYFRDYSVEAWKIDRLQ